MRALRWIKRLFREADRFDSPSSKRPLPKCRIQRFEDSHFEACAEIYRIGEPGRFPAGYFDHFSEWLVSRRDLCVVCEFDGEIDFQTAPYGAGDVGERRALRVSRVLLSYMLRQPPSKAYAKR